MRAYIGLGSNLANPQTQVLSAQNELAKLPQTRLIAASSLYKSPPMGPQDQPDYINAVAALETSLSPNDLLDHLKKVEQQHGRVKQRHWGERTLDLDILLYGQQQIEEEHLHVPHKGIAERAFVLYPLAEIAPELVIPKFGNIEKLLKLCPQDGLERIEKNKI
jgi:2-amino-4-hydroxy-6-hydroxymethyldihydropteridine diphosphokinase